MWYLVSSFQHPEASYANVPILYILYIILFMDASADTYIYTLAVKTHTFYVRSCKWLNAKLGRRRNMSQIKKL